MSKKNDIHYGDVLNLKSMQKRLGLKFSIERLEQARDLMDEEEMTDQEKTRLLLDLPEGTDVSNYITTKLTSREQETVKKLLKPGAL